MVFDQVLTDTAMYADVVLPATTFLEHYDFARGYGPITLQLGKPVIDAVGESRPNTDVFMDLARRLDLTIDGDPADELEAMLSVLGELPQQVGDDLRERWKASPPHGGRPIQFVDVFPKTADRKVDLFPQALDKQAPMGLYGYQPDPATSGIPARADLAGERAHDQLDARRAVAAGGAARDESRGCRRARHRGRRCDSRVECARRNAHQRAHLTPLVQRGIVAMPKGVWRRNTKNGFTSNALVPDSLADLGGGACFNDARVQVEKTSGLVHEMRSSKGVSSKLLTSRYENGGL